MKPHLQILKCFCVIAVTPLLIFSASRLVLVSIEWRRVGEASAFLDIMLQGLRFDSLTITILLIPLVLLLPLAATSGGWFRVWKMTMLLYCSFIFAVLIAMEFITYSFLEFFTARPNQLLLEYIEYPSEIGATIWFAYRFELIFGLLFLVISSLVACRALRKLLVPLNSLSISMAIPLSLIFLLICGLLIRSTIVFESVLADRVAQHQDALFNELSLNSIFSIVYAAKLMRLDEKGGVRYGNMDDDLSLQIVRNEIQIDREQFIDDKSTWHRFFPSIKNSQNKNLVIIIEESLSAEFVGSLGGLDLTPSLDKLAEQGLWFEQLYASGTRTVRGVEAVLSGYIPSMSRSVIKLKRTQESFFTLAEFLKSVGYTTNFIYGGDAGFDNMQAFFLGNGFDSILDQDAFVDPEFIGTWGVSDEEVFARAHHEYEQFHSRSERFFSVILSTSNHTPFQYPPDRIELYSDDKNTVENSVKYADYALGKYFELARTSSYWEDTLFLIVADHNARVYGNSLIPIKRYHIPGLILGSGIEPRKIHSVASQIDLAPTVLSLMGHSGRHPMPGRDLSSRTQNAPGRAIMQFHNTQAYMEGNFVVVLQHNREPESFFYSEGQLSPMPDVDEILVQKAIAHGNWSNIAYERLLYSWTAER